MLCWFLYHNRDVSYSSVLHTAATVRQQRLYKEKGFDIGKWRDLIEQGKELRKEIQRIADEYVRIDRNPYPYLDGAC